MRKCLLLIWVLPILLASCLDFTEEIQFNQDGSGSASYKLNLSKSKIKVSAVMLLDSVNGYAIPSELKVRAKLLSLKSELSKQEGIKNVTLREDWTEYIFQIKFDFDSVSNLNAGFRELAKNNEKGMKYFFDPYSFSSKEFVRHDRFEKIKELEKIKKQNYAALKEANYVCIYRFSGEVEKNLNIGYKTSKNLKALMFKSTLLDLIEQKSSLKNSVSFK
ncbi:MAG: hypothetical protein ACI9J3_001737 [Parvicellaceae bacterium]|jgi:hypothetical protein